MEHIGKILAKSLDPKTIPSHPNLDEYIETAEERKESLRNGLNITSWDNTFENFKMVNGVDESLKAFKELASGHATWHMLLDYGSAGCGKTHLCEALSIEFAKQNIMCSVREWSEVVRHLKRMMRSEIKDDYDIFFERFRKAPRLIIDDVGSGSTGSSWEWGELEDIINYRYKKGLLTVVTSNLNIKDLPDRIVSRFRDAVKSRLILNSAKDYRPLKGGK